MGLPLRESTTKATIVAKETHLATVHNPAASSTTPLALKPPKVCAQLDVALPAVTVAIVLVAVTVVLTDANTICLDQELQEHTKRKHVQEVDLTLTAEFATQATEDQEAEHQMDI